VCRRIHDEDAANHLFVDLEIGLEVELGLTFTFDDELVQFVPGLLETSSHPGPGPNGPITDKDGRLHVFSGRVFSVKRVVAGKVSVESVVEHELGDGKDLFFAVARVVFESGILHD
jgi:hypothetical protein